MLKRIVCIMVCSVLLSGCATAGKLYPDFARQKDSIGNIAVFIDVCFLQDGLERGMIMDVDQNIGLIDLLEKNIRDGLAGKGYPVNSVYAFAGAEMVELDSMPVAIKGRRLDDVPFASEAFLQSGIPLQDVRKAFGALIMAQEKKKGDQANTVISDMSSLKAPGDPDTFIFVRAGGVQVGFMKKLGQAFGTTLMTAGFMYGYSTGTVTVYCYVVSASSGEVVWVDSVRMPSEGSVRWNVADAIRDIVKRFPAK